MQEIVAVNGVSMKYQSPNGETEALRNISFSVGDGEYASIVGPSGCGKSTILSIIAGLISDYSGEVRVYGRTMEGASPHLGYMLQKDHLFDWRTIYQNAMLGLEIRRIKTRENMDYVEHLLKTYGLWEFKNKYPSQLSGGMRQRAALIRTLATKPSILLLDEPFSALDYQTRLAVSDDIYAIIKNEKKTALMVTHDISESVSMSDKVIVLSRRPAITKSIHEITFSGDFPTPLSRREAPEFRLYFNTIWKELDIHV